LYMTELEDALEQRWGTPWRQGRWRGEQQCARP
jgi:hypothetical protein